MYKIESQYTGNPIEIKYRKGIEVEKIIVEGKTVQETTTGKNLIVQPYGDTDKIIDGITYTVNKDYTINAKGTATKKNLFFITKNIWAYDDRLLALKPGTYTFKKTGSASIFLSLNIYKKDNTNQYLKVSTEDKTITVTEDVRLNIRLETLSGKTIDLKNIQIQLEEGKVSTEYEPYTGAKPSPSPDYPQQINNVKGYSNLLDETLINKSDSTYWVTDKISGINIQANKNYYFTTYTSMSVIRVLELGTDKVIKELTDTIELTFNVETSTKVYFTIYKAEGIPTGTKMLFIKGNTQRPYVPYGSNYLELKANGKNLFNKDDINEINAYINNTTKILTSDAMSKTIYIPCEPNTTYTISRTLLGERFNVSSSSKIPTLGMQLEKVSGSYINNTSYSITYTTNANDKYLMAFIYNGGVDKKYTYEEITNGLQIEKGDKATEYEQHQANSTLVNLQNNEICEGDTLIVQNGYASIDKNKKILELTGEENWQFNKDIGGYFQYYIKIENAKPNGLSNYFKYSLTGYVKGNKFYISKKGNFVFMHPTYKGKDIEGLDNWKKFLKDMKLKGTPVIVQYELATNENIELPIVNNLIAYNNYTNIEVIDDLKPNMVIDIKHNLPQSIIDSIKKGKPVKAYLEVQPKNPNEEPIIINEDNYLSTFDLEQFRYIPDEGFIGGCVYNKLVANFINVDNTFNLENRELKLYIGLYDNEKEDYTYIFYGTYIVQKPENENTTDNSKIECADYMIKFNQPYVDRVTYPTTIKTLLLDICEQLNIKLGTTSFANENFVIENNQFVGGESYREVLKAIAMSAFSWARIKQDVLYLDFEVKNNEDIVETITNDYYYQDKLKLQDTMYGPVNRVVMGMTDIDGESEFVEDKDLQIYPLNKNICPSQFDYWESGEYNTSGDIVDNTKRIRLKQLLPVKNNSLLYLDCFNDTIQFNIMTYNQNKEFVRSLGSISNKNTIQLNENEYYLGLILYNYNNESSMTYEKYQEMFAKNEIKPFICLNSEENKEFEAFETNGVCEIVLNDNPFAYTEEKRRELVQAGTKLFGLKYFPLETETVGFIYLDSGDFASIVDMQGIPRNTLILDYTIKYAGAITDKISSPAKTNSQTKYLYTPQLEQIIRKTEYRVDRAEQTITSTVQTINGVVTETNEIKQQVDKITQRYEKTGGNNKIRDSVGLYSHSSDEYWINSETGDFEQGYSQDLVGRTESASQISIRNGTKTTTKNNIVNLMTNKEITLTYKLTNDENTTTTIRLYGNNLLYENIVTDKTELKEYSITFIPDRSDLILEITSKTTQQGWTRISDLMLGDSKLWELAQNETWSRVIETNPFGQLIKAENVDTGLFLGIEGLGIYELNNGQTLGEKKGSLTKDGLETNKVICNDIVQNKLIKTNIDINGNDIYIEYIRSDIQ